MAVQLFGFEIKRKSDEVDNKRVRSFVEPNEGDGSINVTATVPWGRCGNVFRCGYGRLC